MTLFKLFKIRQEERQKNGFYPAIDDSLQSVIKRCS